MLRSSHSNHSSMSCFSLSSLRFGRSSLRLFLRTDLWYQPDHETRILGKMGDAPTYSPDGGRKERQVWMRRRFRKGSHLEASVVLAVGRGRPRGSDLAGSEDCTEGARAVPHMDRAGRSDSQAVECARHTEGLPFRAGQPQVHRPCRSRQRLRLATRGVSTLRGCR